MCHSGYDPVTQLGAQQTRQNMPQSLSAERLETLNRCISVIWRVDDSYLINTDSYCMCECQPCHVITLHIWHFLQTVHQRSTRKVTQLSYTCAHIPFSKMFCPCNMSNPMLRQKWNTKVVTINQFLSFCEGPDIALSTQKLPDQERNIWSLLLPWKRPSYVSELNSPKAIALGIQVVDSNYKGIIKTSEPSQKEEIQLRPKYMAAGLS